MRLARIYFSGELVEHHHLTLPFHTSHYVMHVLRLKIGSSLILFNGDGYDYYATILAQHKKEVVVSIGKTIYQERESTCKIHLAQALSKGDRMDTAIQKAVELGVSQIIPVITDHCAIKLDAERMAKRLIHWRQIVISACEQSGRTCLPELSEVTSFQECIALTHQTKIYCHPGSIATIADIAPTTDILLLIGPEGGLSEQELSYAAACDFKAVSLGPRILRTETAALAAITILQHCFGDM